MKTLSVSLSLAMAVFALFADQTLAQYPQSGGENDIPNPDGTLLQSEEEIWEYLEQLCIEAPTQRCQNMDFILVRDGLTLQMRDYSESDAYHSKRELIEGLRQETLPSGD